MMKTEMSAAETVHAFLNAIKAFDYDAAMTLVA
jgi:hypothetical protein